ncbi:GntP family permease [Lysinibacillus sp. SGAir0095]|uniref:GntP family permease n=1 Tax=Lysinibacillus sp. SGAir0095 TaxID=2070463 RepID=UPI0010CD6322|nr:GntP family permease [Lysinibacillus sp. SGAir0095]QCR32580.1 citrate transporter [Lysinibacillus sp. SGAir0095]
MWSLFIIALSLILLVVLAMRGFTIVIIAPVVSLFVIVLNNMPILETFQTAYMSGFTNYVKNYFLIFLFAAMFGKFMEESGAARTIADYLLRLSGRKSKLRVLVTIMFVCALLTYGGVSLFVVIFAILPIAKPIFKEMDIPWHLFIAAFMPGMATFTMTMLPGTPAVQNIIPTTYLGTTVTSGAWIGLVSAVAVIILNIWYIRFALKRSEIRGETFANMKNLEKEKEPIDDKYADKKLPSLILSLVPPILLLVLLNLVKLEVLYTLMITLFVSAIIFWKYVDKKKDTINIGATNAVLPIINTSADVGYGAVIAATSGFVVFQDFVTNIPGNPLISLFIATNLLAGITGSSSGGLAIAMETLTDLYLKLGVNKEAFHRIVSIASGGLDALPHNGAVITTLVVAGLTHKDAYKHIFATCVIAPLIAAIPGLIVAIMFY